MTPAALADSTVAPDIEPWPRTLDLDRVDWRAGKPTNRTTSLTGTTPSWQTSRCDPVGRLRRFITAADEADAAPVVVLGPDTARSSFGGPAPSGRR